MDEQSFDEFIRKKLDHYEDPDFDESALTEFQVRQDTHRHSSLFTERGSKVAIISAAVFTLLNVYILWIGLPKPNNKPTRDYTYSDQNARIDSLTRVISDLQQTLQKVVVQSNLNTINVTRTDRRATKMVSGNRIAFEPFANEHLLIGRKDRIDSEVLRILIRDKAVTILGNDVFLLTSNDRVGSENFFTSIRQRSYNDLLSLKTKVYPSFPASRASHKHVEQTVSAKVKNAIEKHYFPGIGINIAPHVDAAVGIFSNASGAITPRIGISTDWILSPRLSVETSFNYSTSKYTTSNVEMLPLTSYDNGYGSPVSVDVTTKLLSLPVVIKYRRWIDGKDQFFINAGYVPYIAVARQYEIKYNLTTHHGYDADDKHTISQLERVGGKSFYGGTFSVATGITRKAFKENRIELGLFYEKSLGTVGVEKTNLQLAGIRTALWFRIK